MGPNLKKKIKSHDKPNKKRKMAPEPTVKKDLADQSLDEFINGWDEIGCDSENENPVADQDMELTQKESGNLFKKKKKEVESDESSDEDEEANLKSQKAYMKTLKSTDPEFLKFLEEQGAKGILDQEESDSSAGEEDGVHKIPDKLEIDSDQSDFEFEGEDLGPLEEEEAPYRKDKDNKDKQKSEKQEKISQKMIEDWTNELSEKPTAKTIKTISEAFKAAVTFISEQEVGEGKPSIYKVGTSTIFNSVIRTCVMYLNAAIREVLGLKDKQELTKPRSANKWKKINASLNKYLENLCILVSRVSEPQVSLILIKHTHHMVPYFQGYGKGEKILMKGVIRCWSEGDDSVKVVALLCIVRMAKYMPDMLEPVLAKMHLAYVSNSKFASPTVNPNINFMRRSLVEMYGLDHKLAYYQAFLQIRQLAIQLRTAITDTSQKTVQAVYNWQFIRSLELWGALVCHCQSSELIGQLIYPLVQVIFGTIRLCNGGKVVPLKFHCATLLTKISSETGTFIPVIPIYLDIIKQTDFTKRPKMASMKPLDFTCILKCSKGTRDQSGFKDALMEGCYGGLLTYLAFNSNKVGFPELVTPMLIQIKAFLKTCKIGNYTKIMKQIVEKTVLNQKFIDEKRRNVSFGVGDVKEIEIWEAQIQRDNTPLLTFYMAWKKTSDSRQMLRVTSAITHGQYDVVPHQAKSTKKRADVEKAMKEEGFLSGSDDDSDNEERFQVKEHRKPGEGPEDDLESLNSEDLDELEEGDNNEDDEDAVDMDSQDDSSGDDEEEAGSDADGQEDDISDAEDTGDKVKTLTLEDFDASDSETELKDDFGDASDDDEADSNDDGGSD